MCHDKAIVPYEAMVFVYLSFFLLCSSVSVLSGRHTCAHTHTRTPTPPLLHDIPTHLSRKKTQPWQSHHRATHCNAITKTSAAPAWSWQLLGSAGASLSRVLLSNQTTSWLRDEPRTIWLSGSLTASRESQWPASASVCLTVSSVCVVLRKHAAGAQAQPWPF